MLAASSSHTIYFYRRPPTVSHLCVFAASYAGRCSQRLASHVVHAHPHFLSLGPSASFFIDSSFVGRLPMWRITCTFTRGSSSWHGLAFQQRLDQVLQLSLQSVPTNYQIGYQRGHVITVARPYGIELPRYHVHLCLLLDALRLDDRNSEENQN